MGFFDRLKDSIPQRVRGDELLFCLEEDPNSALSQLEELFRIPPGGTSNRVTVREREVELAFTAFGMAEVAENGAYVQQCLQDAWNRFRLVTASNTDVQRNLLYHLRQCRGVIQVRYSYEGANAQEREERAREAYALMGRAAGCLGGVATRGEAALLNGQARVVLDAGGGSEVDFYLPPEPAPQPDWDGTSSPESRERKARSMAWLRERYLYVTPSLPPLDDAGSWIPRSVSQVCGRAAALLAVSLYSECRLSEGMDYPSARAFTQKVIDLFQAGQFFSPKEQAYLDNPNSSQKEQIPFSWQYENLLVMEWALGLADRLPYPSHVCDVPQAVRVMREHDSLEKLEQACTLRSKEELLDAADLIYRLDWACTDARAMGMPAPAGLDPGVVTERHRALFWLAGCGGQCGWDEVDLST